MCNENYRPFKNGFPYKLLKYLYDNGVSSGATVQKEIGLNAWADSRGAMYYYRASSNFDAIVRQLYARGLVQCLPEDKYELTKSGKTFVKNYNVR
jgi:hypothetical protein